MKHATLISLSLAIGTLGVAACDSNKNSPNSPQDRPPVVSGDSTPPASSASATEVANSDTAAATPSQSATAATADAANSASAAASKPSDPTAAATTGESVTGTGDTRPASKVVDDSWITTKTKTTLLATADLKATDITVETRRGTVTLTGTVPTSSESEKATTVTKGIEGVSKVDNRLTVKP